MLFATKKCFQSFLIGSKVSSVKWFQFPKRRHDFKNHEQKIMGYLTKQCTCLAAAANILCNMAESMSDHEVRVDSASNFRFLHFHAKQFGTQIKKKSAEFAKALFNVWGMVSNFDGKHPISCISIPNWNSKLIFIMWEQDFQRQLLMVTILYEMTRTRTYFPPKNCFYWHNDCTCTLTVIIYTYCYYIFHISSYISKRIY